jgi:trk system potassium uptake protein TrkH
LSGTIPRWIDAFFEAASGFTTTGASVVTDVEVLPRSVLFWRSSTHLVGGMGVLVFALAVMPRIGSDAVHILKAEVPGPVFGKIMPRVHNTARFLYLIYLVLTAILVLLLLMGGMPLFDSLVHAFGAAGTGGFSIKNTSIAFYDSAYIETVLAIGMVLFGINFNLYFLLLFRQAKVALKNEELRWYIGFIVVSILMISLIVMPSTILSRSHDGCVVYGLFHYYDNRLCRE